VVRVLVNSLFPKVAPFATIENGGIKLTFKNQLHKMLSCFGSFQTKQSVSDLSSEITAWCR
jgi:hypothetical protein